MSNIAIAFLTRDRPELSRQTITPLLQPDCFDLFWLDGSDTDAGQNLLAELAPPAVQLRYNVRGGPDAAVAYALTLMLERGYPYVGLCENDVLLGPDWFENSFSLFEMGARAGLAVGAVSARCYEDRILIQRDGYAVCHNLGWGQQIMCRQAAELALRHFRTTHTTENRRTFCNLSGLDIGSWWAFRAGEHWLTADWGNDRVLAQYGLASLALTPSPVRMIGQDPPLDQQGLRLATAPVEARRDEAAYTRYVQRTSAIRDGLITLSPSPVFRDDQGASLYFPHQLGLLEDFRQEGDWRLRFTQGFGPFGWQSGDGAPSLSVTLSGTGELLVSGSKTGWSSGGQVLVEDLHSGYSSKPTLPPAEGGQMLSLMLPCGVSRRPVRLTALTPGVLFHGLRTREPQPERTTWSFEGDYPGLDLGGKSVYRWARQAGALILIFVVGVFYFYEPAFAAGMTKDVSEDHAPTEGGLSYIFGIVPVFDGAYKKQVARTQFDSANFCFAQHMIVGDRNGEGYSASQAKGPHRELANSGLIVRRALRQFGVVVENHRDKVNETDYSVGLSNVHKIQSDGERNIGFQFARKRQAVLGSNPNVLEANFGAVSGKKFASSSIPQSIGGFFQSLRSPIKSASVSSDGNGGEGRPKFSVSDDLEKLKENIVEKILFFALVLCACIGAIAYAHIEGVKYKNPNEKQNKRAQHSKKQ